MNRRKFIHISGGVSLLFSLPSSLVASNGDLSKGSTNATGQIPVINETDVLILGGSTAAVATAVELASKGKSVILVSKETYLGEDVAGHLRYFEQQVASPQSKLGKLLYGKEGVPPTPLELNAH